MCIRDRWGARHETRPAKDMVEGMDEMLSKGISFSLYMTDVYKRQTTTKHFTDKGYNITLIDPVNEPQYDWTEGQEGSPWTNELSLIHI